MLHATSGAESRRMFSTPQSSMTRCTTRYATLQRTPPRCNALRHVATQRTTLQRSTTRCTAQYATLQRSAPWHSCSYVETHHVSEHTFNENYQRFQCHGPPLDCSRRWPRTHPASPRLASPECPSAWEYPGLSTTFRTGGAATQCCTCVRQERLRLPPAFRPAAPATYA